MTASGKYQVAGGAPGGEGATLVIAQAVTVDLTGTLIVDGGTAPGGMATTGGTVVDLGVLANTGSILLLGGSGSSFYAGGSSAGGAGVGRYGGPAGGGALFTDSGVLVNSGSLALGGGGGGRGADATGGAGAVLLANGTLNNQGVLSIGAGTGGTGSGYGGGGATLQVNGTMSNAGQMLLHGGGASSGTNTHFGQGAALQVEGVMTNTGTLFVQGGSTHGVFDGHPSSAHVDVAGAFYNSGLIDLQGYGYAGALNVQAGGMLSMSGASMVHGGGFLVNDGLVSGSGRVDVELVNNGMVMAVAGVLSLDGPIDNHGSFVIGAYGTFEINGQVVYGNDAMTMAGAHATLAGSVAALSGMVLHGFAAGDAVDVADLVPDQLAVSQGAEGTMLQLGGGAALLLAGASMQGAVAGAGWTLGVAADQHGGTMISAVPIGG